MGMIVLYFVHLEHRNGMDGWIRAHWFEGYSQKAIHIMCCYTRGGEMRRFFIPFVPAMFVHLDGVFRSILPFSNGEDS